MAFDGKIGNICVLFQVPIMCMYQVHVTTGDTFWAGTNDHVFVTLVGTNGESERTELDNYGFDFCPNQVRNCSWLFNAFINLRCTIGSAAVQVN